MCTLAMSHFLEDSLTPMANIMTDKERIEKLVQTLMHLKNMVGTLGEMSIQEDVKDGSAQIQRTIEMVIQANADQIVTPK